MSDFLTAKEEQKFRVAKLILSRIPGGSKGDAGFEIEACEEQARLDGVAPGPAYRLPSQIVRMLYRGVSGGANLTGTNLREDLFEGVLRPPTFIYEHGAQLLFLEKGDVAIPAQDTDTVGEWITPGNAPTETVPTYSQRALSPHERGFNVNVSPSVMRQSAAEKLIRQSIAEEATVALEHVALLGAGDPEPTGLISASGIGTPSTTSCDYPAIAAFETLVGAAGGNLRNCCWAMGPTAAAALRIRERVAGLDGFILDRDKTILNYPVEISSNIDAPATIFFGDFSKLIVGTWGLEILVNPYTLSTSGLVTISAFLFADAACLRGASFAISTDFS